MERLKQAQEALNKKILLEEHEKQLHEQYEIEKQLHAEKIKHDNVLKEIQLEADIQEQQKRETRLRISEQISQMETLAHQAKLKEKELEADIAKYENEQTKWKESRYKIHVQDIAFEERQKQLEFESNVKNQKHREQQRLELQKESYQQRKQADIYLQREIELLTLEKQQLELQLAIKDAQKQLEED